MPNKINMTRHCDRVYGSLSIGTNENNWQSSIIHVHLYLCKHPPRPSDHVVMHYQIIALLVHQIHQYMAWSACVWCLCKIYLNSTTISVKIQSTSSLSCSPNGAHGPWTISLSNPMVLVHTYARCPIVFISDRLRQHVRSLFLKKSNIVCLEHFKRKFKKTIIA
jgi:hypothetical protein